MVMITRTTVESVALFKYGPLPDANAFIRVLEIQPDRDENPIRLTMKHIRLKSTYNCLSYTWGNDSASHPVLINGQLFFVRNNLWDFLLQARKNRSDITLPIWIDAITINQNDLTEKNAQVSLMGQIYEQANQVIVWLGQNDERGGASFAFIKNFADTGPFSFREAYSNLNQANQSKIKATLHQMETRASCKRYWDAFDLISSLPYFQRLWIVQEILLAKDLELWYGNEKIAGQILENLCEFISSVPGPPLDVEKGWYKIMQSPCGRIFSRRTSPFKTGSNIRGLFREFSSQKCQNPKDKIYALKSLDTNMKNFPVNYTASSLMLVSELYDHCKIKDTALGHYVIRELGLSHDDIFKATKDLFSGQKWTVLVNDVGVVEELAETESSLVCQVDWSNISIPENPVGEHCQYIEQISVAKPTVPSHATEVRTGDFLLRPGALNIFFIYRPKKSAQETAISSLLDDIYERTPEGKLASKTEIQILNVELAKYEFVSALVVHKDHCSRVSTDRNEAVGEGFAEPLMLNFLPDQTFFAELQRSRFVATQANFGVLIDWKCLLAFWKLCDRPGSLRDEVVHPRIGSWDDEVQKMEEIKVKVGLDLQGIEKSKA